MQVIQDNYSLILISIFNYIINGYLPIKICNILKFMYACSCGYYKGFQEILSCNPKEIQNYMAESEDFY